eukprot:TRINITY_DN63818_c0_g1_i1.p2 TRINITY_DN63818_c0_g1~~TRINITY_DN63818_c0_g1_i1.p2  ORF type:complete len:121 (-),score=26.44 TRINITY_DN63818_c0_g1_i1:18-344(-)
MLRSLVRSEICIRDRMNMMGPPTLSGYRCSEEGMRSGVRFHGDGRLAGGVTSLISASVFMPAASRLLPSSSTSSVFVLCPATCFALLLLTSITAVSYTHLTLPTKRIV